MIRSTFATPLILAAASLFGLVFALTGDGVRDAIACVALVLPVISVAWAMRFKRG